MGLLKAIQGLVEYQYTNITLEMNCKMVVKKVFSNVTYSLELGAAVIYSPKIQTKEWS